MVPPHPQRATDRPQNTPPRIALSYTLGPGLARRLCVFGIRGGSLGLFDVLGAADRDRIPARGETNEGSPARSCRECRARDRLPPPLTSAAETCRKRLRAPVLVLVTAALAVASCAARGRPVFHGDWRVIWFTAPGIWAIGPTEAAGWIGTVARYDKDRAAFGRETCAAPSYATRVMTPDEFAKEYRVRAADLGLQGDAVTVITVTCPSAWSNRGSLLIVKPPDTLLTMWDGVFFELERRTP